MRIKLMHNHYDKSHLMSVIEKMRTMGTPTIKAYKADSNYYIAIEGCHRIRACKELGIVPNIEILTDDNWDDEFVTDDGDVLTIGYMVDANNGDTVITFEEE